LVATLRAAHISFADDPSNRNPQFTRVRVRELMPSLSQEGLGPARLAMLARRFARANAAIERAADAAFSDLQPQYGPGPLVFDAAAFFCAPEEIALRVLGRAIAREGDEGPVELGKLESLHAALAAQFDTASPQLRRTLAGALVTLAGDRLTVERAPPRRTRKRLPPLTKRKGGRRKVGRRR
jgi:tRNA(Ile)-lysidine synthase